MSERKLYRSLTPWLNLYLDDMSIITKANQGDAIVVVEGCPAASMVSCMSKLGMVTILTYHLRMQKLFE